MITLRNNLSLSNKTEMEMKYDSFMIEDTRLKRINSDSCATRQNEFMK